MITAATAHFVRAIVILSWEFFPERSILRQYFVGIELLLRLFTGEVLFPGHGCFHLFCFLFSLLCLITPGIYDSPVNSNYQLTHGISPLIAYTRIVFYRLLYLLLDIFIHKSIRVDYGLSRKTCLVYTLFFWPFRSKKCPAMNCRYSVTVLLMKRLV